MSQRVTDRQYNRISPQENWLKFVKISLFLELTDSKEFRNRSWLNSNRAHRPILVFSLSLLFAKINLRVPHTWIVPSTRQIDLNNFLSQRETACVGAEIWNWSAHRAFFIIKEKGKWQRNNENNGTNCVRIIMKQLMEHISYPRSLQIQSGRQCFSFTFSTRRFSFIYASRIVRFRRSKRLHFQ